MPGPLADRTAIVTGGAEGIGAAISRRLASDGAYVVIADLQDEKGRGLATAIGGDYHRCDVASETDWSALMAHMAAGGRRLDILVNNAGINPGPKAVVDLTLTDWRRILAVNLDGVFLGCQAALKAMGSGPGAIVNISSASGARPNVAYPAYSASKAAVGNLTQAVALYCGEQSLDIRCNAVLPGSVETPLVDRLRAGTGDAAAARARALARHPLGRVGTPDDIAAAVAFLVSDESSFMTGALVPVDGGLGL